MAYQNFFTTRLGTDIGAADTTITLETPPTATSGRLVFEARNATQREIVKYTGVAGNTITGALRGQGGTTARTHLKNSLVEMNATGEDLQDLYDAFSSFAASTGSWLTGVTTISAVAANGNRNYDLTSSADMTTILSPGMRLRTTRTVAAPTQCATFDGVNDYFSKATPAGMTFTDDFVVSAWVKLSSYADATITGRYNGTSGWKLRTLSTGQIMLVGYNGGSGNNRLVQSYQSIPLNKWVHITAQLDMSAHTATTTTSYVMIDGVDVPCSVVQGGTNPTALVQAGDFSVGAGNATEFFPGKIAQVAIFNAKVTQATIRGYISQGLLGTETSLISAYSFNGVITDLNTTNANNLTANGGVLATTADSPFGGQAGGTISSTLDYGIVAKVTASTITVNVAEGCTIPTSGGVSAVSYSTYKSPYGFPAEKDKFRVAVLILSIVAASGGAVGTVYNPGGLNLNVPFGSWELNAQLQTNQTPTTQTVDYYTAISTSASVFNIPELVVREFSAPYASPATRLNTYRAAKCISTTTATPYYILMSPSQTCTMSIRGQINNSNTGEYSILYADNAHL